MGRGWLPKSLAVIGTRTPHYRRLGHYFGALVEAWLRHDQGEALATQTALADGDTAKSRGLRL